MGLRRLFAVIVAAGLGLMIVVALLRPTLDSIQTGAAGRSTGQYEVALLAATCARVGTGSFVECNGSVRNLTSVKIDNVQAVVTWYDSGGTAQRSDTALIEFRPLLAGQDSTFKVIGSWNPALTDFSVVFKRFGGGTIAMRDDR